MFKLVAHCIRISIELYLKTNPGELYSRLYVHDMAVNTSRCKFELQVRDSACADSLFSCEINTTQRGLVATIIIKMKADKGGFVRPSAHPPGYTLVPSLML